jgi:sucrose-phosphate synthase
VATENGGPVDIIGNCNNGLLVDPLNPSAIAESLLRILENRSLWNQFSQRGLENVARFYSWDSHARTYLSKVIPLRNRYAALPKSAPTVRVGPYRKHAIFTAIDNTLLGDAEGLAQFVDYVRKYRKKILFGIATGRRLDSVLSILKIHAIPMPDMLITSLGTEIYYASQLIADRAWAQHINHLWTPNQLRTIIEELPGITRQPRSEQSRFKLSYYYDSSIAPSMDDIQSLLRQNELTVNPTLSFGQYLDLVPSRASKGQALRYIARQWDIPLERILVTGGSGGDDDMLRGNTLGVVVANRHWEELSELSEMKHVYFATKPHAWGILEAVEHYDFFNR